MTDCFAEINSLTEEERQFLLTTSLAASPVKFDDKSTIIEFSLVLERDEFI